MTSEGTSTVARVAVIAYHSSPLLEPGTGDAGGMTVYVREVADRLARRGIRTDIFTRATSDLPRVAELVPGMRVVAIDAGPRRQVDKDQLPAYLDHFMAGTRAFATTQRVAYDVVHSHYWQSGLAAAELARGWGIPMIHSNHTLGRVKNALLAPGDVPESHRRIEGEQAVIAAADVLVASTDEECEQLACLYGAPHDVVKRIHPGVDHDLFSPGDGGAARSRLGLGDEVVLLAVGRIQPLKGLELAVRAVEQLVPALERDVALVVVGGASGRAGENEVAHLRELATSLGIADHVRFLGPKPHDALPDYYRAADVLVATSYSESFGLAALEAHACGVPVVATAVGGLSFIVEDGGSGFLVDERDPAVFAARLKTLVSDRAMQRGFSARARDAARRFSWERTADASLELYECLVTERYPEACTC